VKIHEGVLLQRAYIEHDLEAVEAVSKGCMRCCFQIWNTARILSVEWCMYTCDCGLVKGYTGFVIPPGVSSFREQSGYSVPDGNFGNTAYVLSK
jgi:hypothetical protein